MKETFYLVHNVQRVTGWSSGRWSQYNHLALHTLSLQSHKPMDGVLMGVAAVFNSKHSAEFIMQKSFILSQHKHGIIRLERGGLRSPSIFVEIRGFSHRKRNKLIIQSPPVDINRDNRKLRQSGNSFIAKRPPKSYSRML